MKLSLVITFLNEESTILKLLESIEESSKLPDEVVLVDGGSTDSTVRIIRKYLESNSRFSKNTKLLQKEGNRAKGRNYGVENSGGDVILFTDAGCLLNMNWVLQISQPFTNREIDVVAGYYKGSPENNFGKSLVPYVLVMPEKLDAQNFLPATRSMAIRKKVFEKIGGFDENLSHNEDYAFAKLLEKENIKSKFQENAIVYWTPRKTVKQAFIMFRRFAYGDIEAGIVRPKVVLLFARYIVFLALLAVL